MAEPDLCSQPMISRLACSSRPTNSLSLWTILSICVFLRRISMRAFTISCLSSLI